MADDEYDLRVSDDEPLDSSRRFSRSSSSASSDPSSVARANRRPSQLSKLASQAGAQSRMPSETSQPQRPSQRDSSSSRRDALLQDLEALVRETSEREDRISSKLRELERKGKIAERSENRRADSGADGGFRGVGDDVVPAATTIAGLGSLAAIRENMIKRSQKEEEVRREQQLLEERRKELEELTRRGVRNSVLGSVVGGVSACRRHPLFPNMIAVR